MVLISVEFVIKADKMALAISAPNMKKLVISLDEPQIGEQLSVNVWGDVCEGVDVGEDAQNWFQSYLGCKCSLVRMPDSFKRSTDPVYAPNGQTGFADGFPFLLASKEGLDDLNSRLETPVTMENFRPNIVVQGCKPFQEDSWKVIKVNNIVFKVVKPCSRCKVPTVNPATGKMDPNNEPLKTLKTFRTGLALGFQNKKWEKEIFFGQNLDHEGKTGFVNVGDFIKVVS
jgi:hypothetical protein